MDNKDKKTCCICGCVIERFGNNPFGAVFKRPATGEIVKMNFKDGDRCCDLCDQMYVIPGRMYLSTGITGYLNRKN